MQNSLNTASPKVEFPRRAMLAGLVRSAGFAALAAGGGSMLWAIPSPLSAADPVAPAAEAPAAGVTIPYADVDLCGDWTCGYWKSSCTTHHGKLRAVISCCGPNRYECRFSGTFMKVVLFRYTVPLVVTARGDGIVYFRASKKIPLFGGVFTACGHATACHFHADYSADKDRGVFVMSR